MTLPGNSVRRRDWGAVLVFAAVLLCLGLAVLNAVLFTNHPHGRGPNLVATIWCTIMAAWAFYCWIKVVTSK